MLINAHCFKLTGHTAEHASTNAGGRGTACLSLIAHNYIDTGALQFCIVELFEVKFSEDGTVTLLHG